MKSRSAIHGLWHLMAGTLFAKLSGLVREIMFASWFGTSPVAAAFRISQSAFYQPIHALTGDTLGGGLLPLYNRLRREDEERGRVLVLTAFLHALLIGGVIGGVIYANSAAVVQLFAPGATDEVTQLAIPLVHLTALVVPFYILGNSIGYIETAHGAYSTISSRPALLNIGVLAAGLGTVMTGNVLWLAWGMIGVHTVFCAWTMVAFRRLFTTLPTVDMLRRHSRPVVLSFWRNLGPLLIIPAVTQSALLVERIVASWLGTEAISGVEYARFIAETTLTLSAVPLGIVTLANHGGETSETLTNHIRRTGSFLLVLTVPFAAFLHSSAGDVVRLLFGRGAFNETSVAVTTAVLTGASLAVWAIITSYFLIKALNAQLRNWESVAITACASAVGVAVNLLTWESLGPLALGLGTSATGLVMFCLCVQRLKLWRAFLPLLAWLMCGYLLTKSVVLFIPRFEGTILNLAAQGLVTAIVWGGLYGLAPPIRRASQPLIDRLKKTLVRLRTGIEG